MTTLRIQPHTRPQEWVAHKKGYFDEEGLDYGLLPIRLLPYTQKMYEKTQRWIRERKLFDPMSTIAPYEDVVQRSSRSPT